MVFRSRNCYFLRISERTVLPFYLYLDERHLGWMSDRVLQYVIADLRPLIVPKIKTEAEAVARPGTSGKKSIVDTHRGDSYQFCYFIRNTEPHSLVIKTRRYVAAPPPTRPVLSIRPSAGKGKRKATATKETSTRNKRKKASRRELVVDDDDPIDISTDDDDMYAQEDPIDSDNSMDGGRDEEIVLDIGEEEEKPKPLLRLNYQGFNISGQCICVVVEPWPALDTSKAAKAMPNPPSTDAEQSRLSVPPIRATPVPRAPIRDETPLFLPENEDDAPMLDEVSNFYTIDPDDSYGGMLALSQALNNVGDNRPGASNEDDEMEGAVLFADADEIREL